MIYPMVEDYKTHQILKLLFSSCAVKNRNCVFHIKNGSNIEQYSNFYALRIVHNTLWMGCDKLTS